MEVKEVGSERNRGRREPSEGLNERGNEGVLMKRKTFYYKTLFNYSLSVVVKKQTCPKQRVKKTE